MFGTKAGKQPTTGENPTLVRDSMSSPKVGRKIVIQKLPRILGGVVPDANLSCLPERDHHYLICGRGKIVNTKKRSKKNHTTTCKSLHILLGHIYNLKLIIVSNW